MTFQATLSEYICSFASSLTQSLSVTRTSRVLPLSAILIAIITSLCGVQRVDAGSIFKDDESSSKNPATFNFGFFPGYRTVGGSRPFPLDYLSGGASFDLAIRYFISPRTSLRLTAAFSGSSGEARFLGTYIDDLNRTIRVSIQTPEFSTSSFLLSIEQEWRVGANPITDERIGVRLGGGIHQLGGKATYLYGISNIQIGSELLPYPDDTDPMALVGLTYSKNLSRVFRLEFGVDLPAFLSTDPGFDVFEEFETKGKYVVLLPTIRLGVWLMAK